MAGDKDRPDTEDPGEELEGAGSQPEGRGAEGDALALRSDLPEGEEGAADDDEVQLASQLGVQKFVHAAFFAAGILAAYLFGKLLLAGWNSLADWPDAVRQLPQLLEYTEEERGSLTLVIGAVLGVAVVLRYYRRPSVRSWATDVAGELARVTWPNKDTVTSGTVVVLVAGAVATFYVAVLDRLWSYLTNLVYGT